MTGEWDFHDPSVSTHGEHGEIYRVKSYESSADEFSVFREVLHYVNGTITVFDPEHEAEAREALAQRFELLATGEREEGDHDLARLSEDLAAEIRKGGQTG